MSQVQCWREHNTRFTGTRPPINHCPYGALDARSPLANRHAYPAPLRPREFGVLLTQRMRRLDHVLE